MKSRYSLLATTCAITLLAGCNGGGGGGTITPPTPPTPPTPTTPSYETLDSSASTTSTLGGVSLRSNGTTGELEILTLTGSTTHDTGVTTIGDGTYSITGTLVPNTTNPNIDSTLTDGTSTIEVDDSGPYEYVTSFSQTYTSGGTTYDALGLGGVITSAADVPTTSSATYTGDGGGAINTATQGIDYEGRATVTADFAAGTVDATLTGLTSFDQTTGLATTAPIDTITATGMAIAGNGFGGGTLATTNAGVAVDLTGANTTTSAQGAFFGYDPTISAPDEVGGLLLMQGDDGLIVGGFLAD